MSIGALSWRNIGTVWSHNKNNITDIYSKWLAEKIPAGNAILITDGDMSAQRQLLKAQLAKTRQDNLPLMIDTQRLASPKYHQQLTKKNSLWPTLSEEVASSIRVDEFLILEKLHEAIDKASIYYTHPSFGYFSEQFYTQPQEGIFQLFKYTLGESELNKPKLTKDKAEKEFKLAASAKKIFELFTEQSGNLQGSNFQDSIIIMGWLSRNLNAYGVEFSRNKQNNEAEMFFNTANELFKGSRNGNLIAQANLKQLYALQGKPSEELSTSENLDKFMDNFHKNLDVLYQY